VYPWTTNQAVQRFFRTGKWQRCFPVEVDSVSNSQEGDGPSPEQIVQQGQSIYSQWTNEFESNSIRCLYKKN
jgi:hypothetical protein